jgi:ribonuclease P protein component
MEPDSLEKDETCVHVGAPPGRLKRRAEFKRVSRGRRKSFAAFTLQSAPREDAETDPGCARVGLTVTKKTGNAVERNRIRRRLREALRAASPLEAEGDCDYVLMARREALSRRFAELVNDTRKAFRAAARGTGEGRGEPFRTTAKDKDRRT